MLSVSYAGKNVHSAGKTGALLRGDASGANRCYVVAHCAPYVEPHISSPCAAKSANPPKMCKSQKMTLSPSYKQQVMSCLNDLDEPNMVVLRQLLRSIQSIKKVKKSVRKLAFRCLKTLERKHFSIKRTGTGRPVSK